jgi:hypothetical protein
MQKMIAQQTSFLGSWIGTGDKNSIATNNDIINAYLEGRKDGKEDAFKEIVETLIVNLEAAQNISEAFYHSINQAGKHCFKAYLKVENIEEFRIIYLIETSFFYSEEIDSIYGKAIEIRKTKNKEGFNISFSFLPYNQSLNESKLSADGYVLNYGEK